MLDGDGKAPFEGYGHRTRARPVSLMKTTRTGHLLRPRCRITGMHYYSPAAQERVKDAAYDALEKVLTSMFEPLSRQAMTARWNQAVEAMAKHLEAQDNGTE